jgi:predicted N-acetyltransferase YhbS
MVTAEGPRGATRADVDGVIALVDAAMRQGSDQTMRTDYPLVYADANLPNVQVVLVDGRPVATAPVLPKRVEGDGFAFGMGVISPTATDPPHQHRGYGASCVAACIRRMEAAGLELSVLWTQVATFPFYELNGYQAVERYGEARRLRAADAGRLAAWSGPISTLAEDPARLAEALRLHEAEGPGIVRTPDDARALFALPKMTVWLALDDDRVTASLLESRATNKPGILEAAGDRRAIEGLLRHVLERLGPDATVDVHTGFAPDGLAALAAGPLAATPVVPYDGNMMLRLNDPAGFLRGIRGWLAANRPPDARSVSIAITDMPETPVSIEWRAFGVAIGSKRLPEHVEVTRRELTSALFGAHPSVPVDVPPPLAWLPRFHVPIPVLDRS